MRRQHRADVGAPEQLGDVGGAVVGALQALERERERAFLQVAGVVVHGAAAHVMAVLGDVGEVAEVAEGTDHRHRLVGAQVLQQPVEHAPGAGVGLQAVGDAQLAYALDEVERGVAFLLADDVAEDPAE